MIVMLVGPIDYWWNENCGTPQHEAYSIWREKVSQAFVEAGHLVYRPHEAFKGAWNERAQEVNDRAISMADCLVNMTPPGIPAYGTAEEIKYAREMFIPIYDAPPEDWSRIEGLVRRLKEPYGTVYRKSYTKGLNAREIESYIKAGDDSWNQFWDGVLKEKKEVA